MLRYLTAIVVRYDIAVVAGANFRVGQGLDVIAYGQHQLVCDEAFAHQVESYGVRHLANYDPCFLKCIGLCQDLSAAQ